MARTSASRPCPTSTRSRQCEKRELAQRNRPPIFAEIDTTSSHEPWTRIPPLISWNRIGNGSIFNHVPIDRTGITDPQQGYAKSIQYSLRTLYSFVERYGNKNTVVIALGDHQPSRVISQANHEVPVTIIAHDPKVMDRLSSWGWTNGMLPVSDGAGLAHERVPRPLPQRVRPLARNAVPKKSSLQETSTSASSMAARISSHGRRAIHSAEIPSCATRRGAESGSLRSSTVQRPPGRRAAAPCAITSAHPVTCVSA